MLCVIGNQHREMKTKLKEFSQYLSHEVDDEDKAQEYLDNALPLIGLIVLYFNALESELNSVLCENFTDRTDSTGLIVLNKMNYSAKVDLFKRFCDDFQVGMDRQLIGYEQLITDLNESSRLRNLVVHANWDSTDDEGYTYIRLKMSRQGMKQEYVQFTVDSFSKIIDLTMQTRSNLHDFWDHRNDLLYGRA